MQIHEIGSTLIGNGLESCLTSLLPTASLGEGVTAGAVSALDTPHCGRSSPTDQLPLFSDDGFLIANSSKQTSVTCQTSSSPLSLFRRYISSARLAPISQRQELDPGLQELAEACFLRESGHCDYSKFRTLSLRMSKGFLAALPTRPQNTQLELFSAMRLEGGDSPKKHTRSRSQLRNSIRARILSKYSGSLGNWGIAAPGNSATASDGFPKTDPEFSLWVVTGNIQCRLIEPNRPSLLECLDSEHSDSDRIYSDSTPSFRASATHKLAVMFRAAGGDRTYTEEAPTLRSLANTGGKHQSGSGAWKVVEYKGDEPCLSNCNYQSKPRPLSATEFERLMGWPTGSTEKGITRDGKEITISKTQRQKILGNGIIPQEIEDICLSLKPFLQSS